MKRIDDLVRGNVWGNKSTFRKNMETYNELTKQIEVLLEKKKFFDELATKENDYDYEGLSFKDQLILYKIIDIPVKIKLNDGVDNDCELSSDISLDIFPDVQEYIDLCYRLRERRETREKIVSEDISFQNFGDEENYNEMCYDKHFLVRFDDELVCLNCGASSKDYEIAKDELDFLTCCAECQGMLIKEFSKDELYLFKVLMEENEQNRKHRTPLSYINDEDYLTKAEKHWLDKESVLPEIKRKIRQAQLLDTKKYLDRTGLSEEEAKKPYLQLVREDKIDDVWLGEPKYLSDTRLEELQRQLAEKVANIEKAKAHTEQANILEQCMITKYELAILSGACIPELLAETTTEEEKTALTKAYYNMYSQEGKINSGYFASRYEAIFYDCITASPEINQRILQMKLHLK
ncbi:MAG: hypothetical protein PHX04_04990 [Bacilli bacterium]|nr:hypothetical protein [Bacilli bacterium]